MVKVYTDSDFGHDFGPQEGEHLTCRVCGLERHVWDRPTLTCPGRPLDEVFPGWGERYGRTKQDWRSISTAKGVNR